MTTIAHSYNASNLDAEDRMAVDMICKQIDAETTRINVERAAQIPPLGPLPLIVDSNAARKTAYEGYMQDKCRRMHLNWIERAKELRSEEAAIKAIRQKLPSASDAQLAQIAGILA